MSESVENTEALEAENRELKRLLQELEHRLSVLHCEIARSNFSDMPRLRDCIRHVMIQGPRVFFAKLRGKHE